MKALLQNIIRQFQIFYTYIHFLIKKLFVWAVLHLTVSFGIKIAKEARSTELHTKKLISNMREWKNCQILGLLKYLEI